MGDVLSTVVTLIPIALLIGISVLNAQRKKKREEAQLKTGDMIATISRERPASQTIEEFDAHSLVPDDDDDVRSAAPKPMPYSPPVPRAEPLFAPLPLASMSVLGDHSRASPVLETSPRQAASAAGHTDSTRPAQTSPFARIDRLSPLKKAVVFAELLGEPKGM
jgi:hypothetical protein